MYTCMCAYMCVSELALKAYLSVPLVCLGFVWTDWPLCTEELCHTALGSGKFSTSQVQRCLSNMGQGSPETAIAC